MALGYGGAEQLQLVERGRVLRRGRQDIGNAAQERTFAP